NGVLLRPLPYPQPERLIVVWETFLPQFPLFSVAPATFLDWQSQNTTFENLATFRNARFNLTGNEEPEALQGAQVSASFLQTMAIRPTLGRDFTSEDDREGKSDVVIISHGLWQRRFAGDPMLIGKPITLNGRSVAVIGILPPRFEFPNRQTEVFVPIAF